MLWSAAPAGVTPTGLVTAVTAGVDEEDDSTGGPYARRIVALLRERPASMNRADWYDIVDAFDGVSDVWIYPLMQPTTGTTAIPGTVTVLVTGPIATSVGGLQNGDSPTNTRFISTPGSIRTTIEDYIEGTRDADGVAVADVSLQRQLRPVTLPVGNYSIETPSRSLQSVVAQVTPDANNPFPFVGALTVTGTPTTTTVRVSGTHDVTGKAVQVLVGTAYARGGYMMATPTASTPNAGDTDLTFTAGALLCAPAAATSLYPAPANFDAMRLAAIAMIDSLGPGDASAPSTRWPYVGIKGPATLYLSELASAVLAVDGVLDVVISTPAANVVPAAKTMVDLNLFHVIPI